MYLFKSRVVAKVVEAPIFPFGLDHGRKDPVLGIRKRAELIIHEIDESGLGRLQNLEVFQTGNDFRLTLAGSMNGYGCKSFNGRS